MPTTNAERCKKYRERNLAEKRKRTAERVRAHRLRQKIIIEQIIPKENLPKSDQQTAKPNERFIQVKAETLRTVPQTVDSLTIAPIPVAPIPVTCFFSLPHKKLPPLQPKPDIVPVKIEHDNTIDIEIPSLSTTEQDDTELKSVQVKTEREDDFDFQLPIIQKVEAVQVKVEKEDDTSDLLVPRSIVDGEQIKTVTSRTDGHNNAYERPAAPIPIAPKPREPAKILNAPPNFLTRVILFKFKPSIGVSQMSNQLQQPTTTITANMQPNYQARVSIPAAKMGTEIAKQETSAESAKTLAQKVKERRDKRRLEVLLEKVVHKNRQIKSLTKQNRYLKNRITLLEKCLKSKK